MTEYTDLARVNSLHQELQQVSQAIIHLDNGGTITTVVVSPPPYDPSAPTPAPTTTNMLSMMTVSVQIPGPVDQAILDTIRQALVDRAQQIVDELTSLGVTATPPADPNTRQQENDR